MWHSINREHAIEPRLGERLAVTGPSEPVEQVASGKTFRSFWSLAPPNPRPVGLASEAALHGSVPGVVSSVVNAGNDF